MAFSFIPMSIAALAGVEPQEAGLASGLINASQQIGGALGVAIAATVAFTHTKTLLGSGDSSAQAATSGFALGFCRLCRVRTPNHWNPHHSCARTCAGVAHVPKTER
jgi:hypothetical protein